MNQTPATSRSVLPGLCMGGLLAAGLLSTLFAVASGQRWIDEAPSWDAFQSGRLTRDVAANLAHAPLPTGAAALERGVSWLTIGDLGARVRQGCPGWLFLADELQVHAKAAHDATLRAAAVRQVQAKLNERGIGLLVVVVPDKSRIEAAHLCSLKRPASLANRIDTWLAALPDVATLSLVDALQTRDAATYLRTDTHWSEAGAQRAAQAVATRVRGLPAHRPPDGTLQLTPTAGSPQPRAGDLIRLAGIDWLPASWQPPADVVNVTRFHETRAKGAADAPDADDLFGDAGVPAVALIGSSYSRNSQFSTFLEAALNQRMTIAARDGAAFAGAANSYFASAAFHDTPPRLVVWEIPERALQTPHHDEASPWPGP